MSENICINGHVISPGAPLCRRCNSPAQTPVEQILEQEKSVARPKRMRKTTTKLTAKKSKAK